MTVTVAGINENLRTGTTDPWEWSHSNGTTSPKGVVVMIAHGVSATDHVVSVTYGGVALTRIQRNTDAATELGASEIWFRGDSIPTGTQTVSVDLSSATTDDLFGASYTLDAADYLRVVDFDGRNDNAAADPTVLTLQYGGLTCMAFAVCYSGVTANSSLTVAATCTKDSTTDLAGNFTCGVQHQTTAGSADFSIQWGGVATDDLAFSCMAVSEIPPPAAIAINDRLFVRANGDTCTTERIGRW